MGTAQIHTHTFLPGLLGSPKTPTPILLSKCARHERGVCGHRELHEAGRSQTAVVCTQQIG